MEKIACSECDLLFDKIELHDKEVASCPRCSHVLYYGNFNFPAAIAILLATLLVFIPAILLPFLSMELSGQVKEISIMGTVLLASENRTVALSCIVFLLVISIPMTRLIGLLFIIIPVSLNKQVPFDQSMIRFIVKLEPWAMCEVYLIAVIVTLVKLAHLAHIGFSIGFFAFCIFIILNTIVSLNMSAKRVWSLLT